jgi:hypothetical protein
MTQLASDNFTRANAANLGANWTDPAVEFSIVSNNAVAVLGGAALVLYNAVAAPNDGYAEVTLGSAVDATTDQGLGPAYRVNTGSATAYFGQINHIESKIYKVVTGVFTQLGVGPPGATGDVWRLTASGTSISLAQNGTTQITVTDAAIASGSAGMWGAANSVADTVSLWAFGDLNVVSISIAWVV